jgi:lactate permease
VTPYRQTDAPVGSLALSALLAALPLLTLFVTLGGLRWRAWKAGLASLVVALVVAVTAYGMPFGQAVLAGTEGAAFGLFPIIWIVLNAIWVFKLTEITGWDAVLRRAFSTLSDDRRIQAVIIAFCFGALLEALAGFGTPVAVTSVMLMAVGLRPMKAATVALVANTAPVAFGAIAVPITTLGTVSGLDATTLAAMVGRQTPLIAAFVPLILVFMVDGRRGLRQTWPAALAGGLAFAVAQFLASNYLPYQITDIVASLVAALAVLALLRVWQPAAAGPETESVPAPAAGGSADAEAGAARVFAEENRRRQTGEGSALLAAVPYLIIVVLFALVTIGPVKKWLDTHSGWKFGWPGLHVLNAAGKPVSTVTFNLNVFNAAGTVLLVAGILTALVYRVRPGRALRAYGDTLGQFRWTILTVALVLGLAYVMNLSGQTVTLGLFLAATGSLFALLSPVVGWLGTAVTGSDTSSNSLFGLLQQTAATRTGLPPYLLAAANATGGVVGKMVSPQNLAIAAAAVGADGREGDIFRRVLWWGLGILAVICVLVFLQSTPVLGWMVV